jgi:hypothetical protein
MAIGKKTGGRDFKKGQSGNPNGRPPVPHEIRELRKHNRREVEETLSKYLRMTAAELEEVAKSPYTPALDGMVVAVIMMAARNGDQWRFNFLLDRVIGKVPDRVADADGQPLMATFIDLIRLAKEKK